MFVVFFNFLCSNMFRLVIWDKFIELLFFSKHFFYVLFFFYNIKWFLLFNFLGTFFCLFYEILSLQPLLVNFILAQLEIFYFVLLNLFLDFSHFLIMFFLLSLKNLHDFCIFFPLQFFSFILFFPHPQNQFTFRTRLDLVFIIGSTFS